MEVPSKLGDGVLDQDDCNIEVEFAHAGSILQSSDKQLKNPLSLNLSLAKDVAKNAQSYNMKH